MLDEAKEYSVSPLLDLYRRAPVEIIAGEGSYLIDATGKRHLDFGTGIAVNALGHGHPKLMDRLTQQAQALWHCSNKFHIRSQIECAQILKRATFADRVFFCNSGAEANEGALKIMRRHQYASGRPERWHCITFEGAFHGRTLATLSATGRTDYQTGFGPPVPGFTQASFNDLASVERALTAETAGILMEPIQGEGGVRAFDPGFVRELRTLTLERDLLLLFDEIQTGVGRTGSFLACEQFDVTPDIVSLAKGLGGGFPIGAVLCSEAVAQSMVPGSHGTTFGGNPLGCAIATEVISEVLSEGFLPHVREMGEQLSAGLGRLVASFPAILREHRGLGLIQGLQTHGPAAAFEMICLEQGLIVMAAADNVVRLLPPLTTSAKEISTAIQTLENVCHECSRNTTADRSRASRPRAEAEQTTKCVATTINLSDREIEILRPAHLEPIACQKTMLGETLIALGATVLITDQFPTKESIANWRDNVAGPLIVAEFRHSDAIPVHITRSFNQNDLICCHFDRRTVSLEQALSEAEHTHAYRAPILPAPTARSTEYPSSKSVAVVGAGIVSLISALEFAKVGYAVHVFEKSPDPRSRPDWTRLGCTHGGEGVRMFSLTECDNYHERSSRGDPKLHQFIDTAPDRMGWGLGEEKRFGAKDLAWKSEFRDVPIFLADHYNEDIFALNHESYRLWRDTIDDEPALFQDVVLTEGLLRICRTEAYHHKQLQRQKHVRAFVREWDRANLVEAYPALETGCANGEIYGGIEVEGFTLDIHRFVRNVLDTAERLGVIFHWATPVEGIPRSGDMVSGVLVDGTAHRADHYFVSPGAYADGLLDLTETRGSVHGVLGAWISFPNTEPMLQRSLKVSREGYVASSGNIILNKDDDGSDRLIFGSGFGYLGAYAGNICRARLDRLFESMQDYIGRLFPEALKAALDDGSLMARRKYCVRPWTPTCLGVFEIQAAETGCLIVATGHNTGGFSQSTGIAKAALAAMRGDPHPMHHLYSPKRFRAFW